MDDYSVGTTLLVNDYILFTFKEQNLITGLLLLFQRDELKVKILKREKKEILEAKAYYETSLSNIIERLNIIGFPSALAEISYLLGINKIKEAEYKYAAEFYSADEYEAFVEQVDYIFSGTRDDFNLALKTLIDKKIYPNNRTKYKGKNPFCEFLLSGTNDIILRYPGGKPIYALFHFLNEIYPADISIKYDFSGIIDYEYFDRSVYDRYDETVLSENHPFRLGEKIIILTEGTMDSRILEMSLGILFPHLKGYFYFMDFDLSKAPGSVGHLLNNIKAFVAAGIKNRIVAIFDNDTAARDSIAALDNIEIPNNISIMHLPELEFAKEYPTIENGKIVKKNINGLACSIELYLGDDIIKEHGKYIPVQWKGLNPALKEYQGEIMRKNLIQKRFFKYLKKFKTDPSLIKEKDWTSMRKIFDCIFENCASRGFNDPYDPYS